MLALSVTLACFAVPLAAVLIHVATARPSTYRPRPDGHANEWAARKARAAQ